MEKYTGLWRLESSDKFEEYMKAIGIGFMLRKLGNTVKPDIRFVLNDDGSYKLLTISTFKNTELTFKLDEEFEETTIDGRKVTSIIKLEEDGSLMHKQASKPESVIVRRIDENGKLACTVTAGDVVCTRIYCKVDE